MFSLYGLMIWCPEYLKLLRAIEYEAQTQQLKVNYNSTTFTGSWENRQYKDSTFTNCRYKNVILIYLNKVAYCCARSRIRAPGNNNIVF